MITFINECMANSLSDWKQESGTFNKRKKTRYVVASHNEKVSIAFCEHYGKQTTVYELLPRTHASETVPDWIKDVLKTMKQRSKGTEFSFLGSLFDLYK